MSKQKAVAVALLASAALFMAPACAEKYAPKDYEFDLPAQDLGDALRAVTARAGWELYATANDVNGIAAPALHGTMAASEAVEQLLRGTGLKATIKDGAVIVRGRSGAAVSDSTSTADIVVTGSRIHGAPAISPTMTVTRDEAIKSGEMDLGDVIRDLPQNFSGGQNPTIAGGGQGSFTNTAGASAINLRGLGPDATLTLFNGHRVAFDAISQGIDISAIPMAAIERVDIVTDGASALYGSDAVGGVANVILRRDFNGLATSARIGSTTDGGGFTQQYDAVSGAKWRTGGIMIAADYLKSAEISAGDRSYTSNIYPTYTLIPGQRQLSFVAAGHQNLSDAVAFELDGSYLRRTSYRCLTITAADDCTATGDTVGTKAISYSVTPSINLKLPSRWSAKLSGTYSKSDTYVTSSVYDSGSKLAYVLPKYFDTLKNVEIGAEGPLFALAGGDVRAAVGAGYRSSALDVDSRFFSGAAESTLDLFRQSQNVLFQYAELFVPIVSGENGQSLIRKLEFSAAIRHEDYRHLASVTTPKLGLLYSPAPFLELKASWGKSFKAPTLYQTGETSNAQLVDAADFVPSPSNVLPVLYLFGGNRNLKPERARTWTVSGKIEFPFLEGFSLSASYFNIRYRNRVAEPLLSSTNAFNSIYANYVKLSPTAADVLGAIDDVTGSFENLTAGAFDPSSVSAIVYDQLQNVSVLNAHGIDIATRYSTNIGGNGKITVNGTATYLASDRQITDDLPAQSVAGIIFNPPHWRARMSASWENNQFTVTAVGNYIGATRDNRLSPEFAVNAFTDLDAIVQMRSVARTGLLKNISWTLAVENMFNRRPSAVRNSDPLGLRYDSVNNSTYGRTISLTLNKAW